MNRRTVTLAVSAVLCAYGLGRAIAMRWVCDDAFICFRYADNLLAGKGLVWNAGERVEAITNLGWTLLIALFRVPGWDPIVLAELLGVLSFAALLWLAYRLETDGASDALPWGTWAIAVQPDLIEWTTGGLETMTAGALAVASALAVRKQKWIAAGALVAVMYSVRPDAVLISAAVVGLAGWEHRRKILLAALVAAAGIGAITAFRYGYYGDLLPNSFYAKSGGSSYWSHGASHFGLLFAGSPMLALLGAVFAAWRFRHRGRGLLPSDVWLIAAFVYVLYVIRSGGDYMHARRYVPALPLMLLAFTQPLREALSKPVWIAGALAVALLAVPVPIFSLFGQPHAGTLRIGDVADERSELPPWVIELSQKQGPMLEQLFHDIPDAHFVFEGGLCVLAYYSRLSYLQEPNGLTDRESARRPVGDERGRPGHEAVISNERLNQLKVQLVLGQNYMPQLAMFNVIQLPQLRLTLRTRYYDDAVMTPLLAKPGVEAESAEALLKNTDQVLDTASCDDARGMMGVLDSYYFLSPAPHAGREPFAHKVEQRCGTP